MNIIENFRKLSLPGLFILAIPFWMLVPTPEARATHAAGAELTYHCLGGLSYEVYAVFYRDCGGTPEPSTLTIAYKSASCNYARTIMATKVATGNGTEITLPCTTMPSSCNGGNSTGIVRWVYRAVVTLPFACNDWTFSYRVCCRNCTVTTIQAPCATGSELYVEAKLNNLAAPCNSSPVYGNSPIAFVCLGQNFNYNQGTFDPDGDSLSYELIVPKTSATGEVTFIPPATAASPIASSTPFTINPVSGDINFTPSMNQIAVMAIRVNEYRNGQWIGSTIRDMQIYTQICFNTIPYASGVNGTNLFSTTACAGQPLCFTIQTFDNDINQNVTVTWNNPISGAVITQSGTQRPQLTFCWTPTTADVSTIPKTFTILVKDNACPQNGMQSFSYTITVASAEVSVVTTDPLCYGTSGSAAIGGNPIPGYTYQWSTTPPQQGPSASGLNPGAYAVIATSPEGCTASAAFTINPSPSAISVTAQASGLITCQSGNIGSASATVTGGSGGYTYQWSTGNTTAQINGLGAGLYTVTVTDAQGCTASDTVSVLQAPGDLTATLSQMNMVGCKGDLTGSATLSHTGGSAPFTYLWSNGITTATAQQLAAGAYTCTITDVNGCSAMVVAVITEPAQPLIVANQNIQHINCNTQSGGALSVQVTGGTTPYTYSWSNGASATSIGQLPAGNYQLTVTDANSCSAYYTDTIKDISIPVQVTTLAIQQVQCYGGQNGYVNIDITSGTAPFTFHWSNGAVTQNITNVSAGIYTVTVTDVQLCSKTESFEITQPSTPLAGTVNVITPIHCFGGTEGSLEAVVVGGTPSYSYYWSNGVTSPVNADIPAGSYTLTITDAAGCTHSSNYMLDQPPVLSLTGMVTNTSCMNGAGGSISITPAGGTAPFHFIWSNGSNAQNLQGLIAGLYTITVTDINQCSINHTFEVLHQAGTLGGNIVIIDPVKCHGGNEGKLEVTIAGGSAPYNYQWSHGANTPVVSGLTAGVYSVTVVDANGCTYSGTSTLTQPVELSLAATVVHADCMKEPDGSVTVTPSGGTPPYLYEWSNGGGTSGVISSLSAGIYHCTITDANGCSVMEAFTVQNLSVPVIPVDTLHVICVGEMATLTIDSLPNSTYQWYFEGNLLNGATSNTFLTPAAGRYFVKVTNACGEFKSDIIRVEVKSIGNVTINNMQIICPPETASLLATGGVSYLWNPNSYITFNNIPDPIVSPPITTTYTVEITNEFGCKTTLSTNIAVVCDSLLVPTGFSPNDDGVNDGYVIDGIENYPGNKLFVYNRYGRLVFKATDYANSWDGVSNVSGLYMNKKLPTGTYFYILDLNDRSKPRAGFIVLRR